MDPSQCWDDMLVAYATKQWQEARGCAEALLEWLERGGFPPQPTIGTTTLSFTTQLDADFSRVLCLAACRHILEQTQEVPNAAC